MHYFASPFKDRLLVAGYAFIPISLFFFCLPGWLAEEPEAHFGYFLLNFFFTALYFVILRMDVRNKVAEHRLQYILLQLILSLISAYSLNREVEVFAASTGWFSAVLVLLCLNYAGAVFFPVLPKVVRLLQFFLFGLSLMVFLYLSVYVLPLYFLSAFALLALGISIHTFIPALFVYYTCRLAGKLAGNLRDYWISFGCGIALALFAVFLHAAAWNATVRNMNASFSRAISDGDELPAWIRVAQKTEQGGIAEKVLKTGLVYVQPQWEEDLFLSIPRATFGEEQKVHDPLVVVSGLFSPRLYLNEEDRIQLLKGSFGKRHAAEERLWSGIDLRTENVSTNVQIWPQWRIAYTEKILTVFNHSTARWGFNQQEAIYTFQLPEGGVITSLSLWINGKEEKGVLTTKEKADTAYKTIVGVVRRDPSVVHWQEGNRVSVRVFPVLENSNRVFKIGITAPLSVKGDELVYEDISFEGPDAASATEDVKVQLAGHNLSPLYAASLQDEGNNRFTRFGSYRSRWNFRMKDLGMSPGSFSFRNRQYTVKPYEPQRAPLQVTDVFLDLNTSWTKAEFEDMWRSVSDRKVWVYAGELVQLTESNREFLFDRLKEQQFSLFPLHLISNPEHSLLVSKSGNRTPNLSDLKDSPFLEALKAWAKGGKKVPLFHLGTEVSPYLASLKEYRCFHYEQGYLNDLQQLLRQGLFERNAETGEEVVIHSAGLSIARTEGTAPSTAPDHLMRLFAYNSILQQLGQQGLNGLPQGDTLVNQAEEAYVVSPVSSLIVLETAADYERFDIKAEANSLENATLQSKGAVPEPHEWILILLVAVAAFYFFLKSRI